MDIAASRASTLPIFSTASTGFNMHPTPGKPTDNVFVGSLNGTFRAECLDTNWLQTLAEGKQIIDSWKYEYNESRPHRALANRTPKEFARQIAVQRDPTETQTSRFLTL